MDARTNHCDHRLPMPNKVPLRAEALIVLAELESIDGSIALLEGALREAESSPVLQADIQIRLASAIRFREGFRQGSPTRRRMRSSSQSVSTMTRSTCEHSPSWRISAR